MTPVSLLLFLSSCSTPQQTPMTPPTRPVDRQKSHYLQCLTGLNAISSDTQTSPISNSTSTGAGHQITQSARCPHTDLWPSRPEWQLVVCKPIAMINRPLIPNTSTAATTTHAPLKCNHPSSLGPHIRNCWVDVRRAGFMRFPMELGQRWGEHNRVSCFHKCNSWGPERRRAKRRRRRWKEREIGEAEDGDAVRGNEGRGQNFVEKRDKKEWEFIACCRNGVILGLCSSCWIWSAEAFLPPVLFCLSTVCLLLQEKKKRNGDKFFAYWVMIITTVSRQLELFPPKTQNSTSPAERHSGDSGWGLIQ